MVIWRLTDGKPGHEKQTLGLSHALLRKRPGEYVDIALSACGGSLRQWLRGRFPAGADLPRPDFILAAGHATHFALLAARRAYGGRAVVLMKPSLPLALFDLCIIPEHDAPPHRANVIATRGVLNDVQTSNHSSPNHGLMLIGGISSHFGWDDASVAAAVCKIAQSTPHVSWKLTTSRRTPASFPGSLQQPLPGNLQLIPHESTAPGWLEQTLTKAGQVWVTEDSVSMLYEALTAGAGVGLLRLPDPRDSRVLRGIDKLLAEGWVTPFDVWQPGLTLTRLSVQFNEADRVSAYLLNPLAATR